VIPTDVQALLGDVGTLSTSAVLQALLVALALGLAVAHAYRWSLPGRVVPPSLVGALILLPMVTCMVLMVIGNSLARAFSLVGALAIVRFRTRLQSTWDISFVFLTLAVGIACGVGALKIAALSTIVILLAVAVIGVLPGSRPWLDVVMIRVDVAALECGEQHIAGTLDRYARRRARVGVRSMRFGEALSLTFRVILREQGSSEALVRDLSVIEGVERVVVLEDDDGVDEG